MDNNSEEWQIKVLGVKNQQKNIDFAIYLNKLDIRLALCIEDMLKFTK